MFTLTSADFSLDEDGNTIAVLTIVSEIERDEEAAFITASIGKEFTLTPQ